MRKNGLMSLIGNGLLGIASLVGCDEEKISDVEVKHSNTLGGVVGVEPKEIEYDCRFDWTDKGLLEKLGVKPEVANGYDERRFHTGWIVSELAKEGITSEIANSSHVSLRYNDLIQLGKNGVREPEIFNPYAKAFDWISGKEIAFLVNAGVSVERTREWRALELGNDTNVNWGDRKSFTYEQIAKLHEAGKSPLDAQLYDTSFTSTSVFHLMQHGGINYSEANRFAELNKKYGAKISGVDIITYRNEGISFEEVEQQAKKSWFESSVRN